MSRESEPDFEDAQDEIRWLRECLSAERKRREQAEQERDAEREAVGLSAEDRDSAIQRAERAEANNAVLMEQMRALETFRENMAKAVDGWGHADDCPSGYEDAPDDACECVSGEVCKMLEAVKP